MQKSRRRRRNRRRAATRRRQNRNRRATGGGKCDDFDEERCVVKCAPKEEPPKKFPPPRNLRIYKMTREADPQNPDILNIKLNEHFPTAAELKKMKLATDDPKMEEDKTHIRNTRVNSRMNYDDIDKGLFKPFRARERINPHSEIYASTNKWVVET